MLSSRSRYIGKHALFLADFLPLYCSSSPCGAVCDPAVCTISPGGYALASKGLYRLHQFSKVELFGVTAQETGGESEEMLNDMVSLQKEVLSSLELPYR